MWMFAYLSLHFVLTIFPLCTWGSNARNSSIEVHRARSSEHMNKLTRLGRADRLRRGSVQEEASKEGKRAAFMFADANNLKELLHNLDDGRKHVGKREHNRRRQVMKCLQQTSDGITCFGNGKFYQFTGSLDRMTADRISKMVHESDNEVADHAEYVPASLGRSLTKKIWKKRSIQRNSAARPYQEVLMQSHGLAMGPRDCYGFVAPNNIHNPTNTVNKPCGKKCDHRMCQCGGGCRRQPRNWRFADGKKSHGVMKRSHMITVACRPLYVPTPKPSVNEGRVAKCRLPCGEHNCLVVPTCPCMPPCKTQAPCPSTCPPEKPMPCCTKPPDVTRCPPYEITEEPCPSFPCPDKFPFLTTPHCPCSKESCSSCGCSKETQCTTGCPTKSTCSSEKPTCSHKPACSDRPSCNSKVIAGAVTTAVANRSNSSSATPMPCKSKNVAGAIVTEKSNVSAIAVSRLSPSVGPIAINGSLKADTTGKKMRGNLISRADTLDIAEPVKLRPKIMGLWPSFDLRKLLKSATFQNKDKTEHDKVEPVVPIYSQ